MPRTVDSIVEAHQIAQKRRSRGLPTWSGTLTFLPELTRLVEAMQADCSLDSAHALLEGLKGAAAEVRQKVPEASLPLQPLEHEDLYFFVEELEAFTLESMQEDDILDEVDNALDRLYDWCDRHRWWIQPS